MTTAGNLANNLDKVSYNTYFSTDKIVKTLFGRFNYTTDTITRSYTLAGFPNNVQVYRFAHGYTRPVFVELFWSLDNSRYTIGAGSNDNNGEYAISYSDSTYIYIMTTPLVANTVVYYKLVLSWIDNYDTTNPTVGAFAEVPANYTEVFTSESLTASIIQQGVLTASTVSAIITDVTKSDLHNASYSPEMKVFVEAFSGEVWPLNFGGANNPYNVDDSQVEGMAFTSSTDITVDFVMKASNGTRKAWYFLYGKRSTPRTAVYGSAQNVI